MAKVHNILHVSLLQKADVDPSRVLPQVLVEVKEDLTLEVRPIKILDWGEKELRNKKVPTSESYGEAHKSRKKHGRENQK